MKHHVNSEEPNMGILNKQLMPLTVEPLPQPGVYFLGDSYSEKNEEISKQFWILSF